jgi:hypothetical protein
MSTPNNNQNNRRRSQHSIQTIRKTESIISNQVFANRRNEIHEYLKLFGCKPDKTIIQVHITGFFRKRQLSQREKERYTLAAKKYGGTTFVIVGRTHDPSILENVIKSRKKNPLDTSPGYVGYLWKNKDPQKRAPHELIPLDFTPIHLPYPTDWKNMFATKGFMLALHVPASFAKDKNKLVRALYRIGKSSIVDIKKEWTFLNEIRHLGFDMKRTTITRADYPQSTSAGGGHNMNSAVNTAKGVGSRLAKDKVSKEEYQEMLKAIKS